MVVVQTNYNGRLYKHFHHCVGLRIYARACESARVFVYIAKQKINMSLDRTCKQTLPFSALMFFQTLGYGKTFQWQNSFQSKNDSNVAFRLSNF